MSDARRAPSFDEWQAISSLLHLYASAIDDGDFDRLGEVFSADSVSVYQGAPINGAAEMIETMRQWQLGLRSQHVVTNITIEVSDDGALAWARSYYSARTRRPRVPDSLYSVGGRYDDQLALTPGGWRIAARTARNMWDSGTVPSADPS